MLFALALMPARAQWAGYSDILAGGTNFVPNVATNTYTNLTAYVDATRQEYVAIGLQYKFHTAPVGATPSVTMRLQRSFDGTNWESTAQHVLLANGVTNTCTWFTNLHSQGIPYYRLQTVENTNSAVITNVFLWYGTKKVF